MRGFKFYLRAIGRLDGVGSWVKVQAACKSKCDNGVWTCDKTEGVGRAVVALWKVSVERVNDGVRFVCYFFRAFPLTDAWAASICKNGCTNRFQIGEQSISLNRCANLFGARSNQQFNFALQPMRLCLPGNGCSSGDVFIRGVCATTDKRRRDLERPTIFVCSLLDCVADFVRAVGGVRAIDERLQRAEINLDHVVVVSSIIWAQMFANSVCGGGDVGTPCCLQILRDLRVVWKHGTRCANLGAHVANGCFACGRDAVCTFAEVFDDCASATFNGEHSSHFKNDVFRA